MKHLLTISCVLMLAGIAFSQVPDKALIKVQYAFTHVRDTTQRDKPYTETMLLFAGKNASLYLSMDLTLRDEDFMRRILESRKTGQPMSGGPRYREFSNVEYYVFPKEHKLISKEEINGLYLVEDVYPEISWKILKDTMTFSGIHCQKAVAAFKGRNWIAWFAPDMPFQAGPWKLNGLPGLIIEAYDDKKDVQFKFNGTEAVKPDDQFVEKDHPDSHRTEIILPVRLNGNTFIRLSRKEFEKLKDAHDKDPQGFQDAELRAKGITNPEVLKIGTYWGYSRKGDQIVDVNEIPMSQRSVPKPKPTVSNPIELPEKK